MCIVDWAPYAECDHWTSDSRQKQQRNHLYFAEDEKIRLLLLVLVCVCVCAIRYTQIHLNVKPNPILLIENCVRSFEQTEQPRLVSCAAACIWFVLRCFALPLR